MNVTCDKCKEMFDIKMKSREIDEDLEQEYFECPKCNEEYPVNIINYKSKKLRIEIQELQQEYNKRKTIGTMNGIKSKQKEFKEEMLKINKKR